MSESTVASEDSSLITHHSLLPWRSRGDVLRSRFGERVQKLSIDAGFTCPNLDGTKARGGCTYCNNASFSAAVGLRRKFTISEQLERARAFYAARSSARKYLAYFQPYTNTYAPLETLRAVYDEALAFPGVVGLAIGTRPDCVPDPVLDLLESYARGGVYIYLELGLQTANDETQRRTNRAHGLADFEDAVARAAGRGLELCAHVILGLPGEGPADARRTAEALAPLPVDAVKIHHFYVCEGTPLADEWRAGRVAPPELPVYIELLADFLERIPERIAIERICADCRPALLIAPNFRGGVTEVGRRLKEEMMRRGTRQGSFVTGAALAAALGGLALALAGCPSPEPAKPQPMVATQPTATTATAGAASSSASGGTTAASSGAPGAKTPPPPDFWVNRFGGYMTPSFRQEYLDTPEDERFHKYGDKLLEFQRREKLLDPYRARLSPTEIEQYRALPDYDSSQKFIDDRFPKK